MIAPGAAAAGTLHLAASLPAWRTFRAALDDPRVAQARVAEAILRGGAGGAFAREHGLDPAEGLGGLRRRVPPRGWDELQPWVARAAAGEPRVLSDAPVLRFQPSSGSAAPSKLVPWTAPLAAELRRAIAPWLADMALRHPALLGGPAYWSVSPAAPPLPATAGGIPVGFEDDAGYLGPLARRLAGWALAVPGAVRHLEEVGAWRFRTLLQLLRARELRLLSVWSPTFLELLLAPLGPLLGPLVEEIARGTPPRAAGAGWLPPLPPDPARAAEVERAGADPRALWPRLALVSAWTDGPSEGPAARLAALLPGVPVEAKGLVATEGVVSIPFGGARPLAVGSHLLELEVAGEARLVHELREGDVGEVLLTTGGGLWRYRLGDRVEVTGFLRRTPCIRFLGKVDTVSDLVGEKLHAGHAEAVIRRLLSEAAVPTEALAFLAPDEGGERPGYTLFLAVPAPLPAGMDARLEALLAESFHYAHAVRLGQLRPARLFLVEGSGWEPFHRACAARGRRLGDVKPAALRRDGGWAEALPGRYA